MRGRLLLSRLDLLEADIVRLGGGNQRHLVVLVEDVEKGVAQNEDAAQAPHVDLDSVVTAEDYLRGAVKPALDVIIEFPLCVTTGVKVLSP